MKEWSERMAEERLPMFKNSIPGTFSLYTRPGNSHRREVSSRTEHRAHPNNVKIDIEDTSNKEVISNCSLSRVRKANKYSYHTTEYILMYKMIFFKFPHNYSSDFSFSSSLLVQGKFANFTIVIINS